MKHSNKLQALLRSIKHDPDQPTAPGANDILDRIRNNSKQQALVKDLRETFYQNLVTLQWGPPRLGSFNNPSTDWYHEVSYDRRALIEDPTVIILMWPHHQPIPKDIEHTADFLGHAFVCEFHHDVVLRVKDDDARWEWQQRFVPQDKELALAGETE
jgi:hypothetical protein